MAFTDHSNVYAAAHEAGFNKIVRWFARYRPTLVNYGTAWVAQEPFKRLCQKPDVIQDIRDRGLAIVSVERPLPIPTTPYGMNWSLQLTDLEIDFHPTSVFALPPELGERLEPQPFGLRLRACFGLGCPSPRLEEVLDDLGARLGDVVERVPGAQRADPAAPGHQLLELLHGARLVQPCRRVRDVSGPVPQHHAAIIPHPRRPHRPGQPVALLGDGDAE